MPCLALISVGWRWLSNGQSQSKIILKSARAGWSWELYEKEMQEKKRKKGKEEKKKCNTPSRSKVFRVRWKRHLVFLRASVMQNPIRPSNKVGLYVDRRMRKGTTHNLNPGTQAKWPHPPWRCGVWQHIPKLTFTEAWTSRVQNKAWPLF